MPDVAKTHAFGLKTNLKIDSSEKHVVIIALIKRVFKSVFRRKYSRCVPLRRMGLYVASTSLVQERGMIH